MTAEVTRTLSSKASDTSLVWIASKYHKNGPAIE